MAKKTLPLNNEIKQRRMRDILKDVLYIILANLKTIFMSLIKNKVTEVIFLKLFGVATATGFLPWLVEWLIIKDLIMEKWVLGFINARIRNCKYGFDVIDGIYQVKRLNEARLKGDGKTINDIMDHA